MWVASDFPEAGPTLEQSRILGEVTKSAYGKWPSKAIRAFWGVVSFHRYKKPEFVQKIIKKYKLGKMDFHNPFLIKYIYDIFDEEIIPRIEHKYNYKVNGTINNLPVCTNSKNLPSVIQCGEYNNMVYTLASYLDSNT